MVELPVTPTMVTIFPEIVATDVLELVYVTAPGLFEKTLIVKFGLAVVFAGIE
jgi:hypothetical protein